MKSDAILDCLKTAGEFQLDAACLDKCDPLAATPRQLFGTATDKFWFWLNTIGCRENPRIKSMLPGMPLGDIQLRFTGQQGDQALADGFATYGVLKHYVEYRLGPLSGLTNVLDFGCGWGRIIRFFLRDIEGTKLWGADCQADAIEICKATNRWCQFKLVEPAPPTDFAAASFDLIYCFSVFSHLSEQSHQAWLTEFARILRPGGMLIATTRPRAFISHCARLREKADLPDHARGSAMAFPDTSTTLQDFDNGRFCFSPPPNGGRIGAFYGQAAIPRGYVERRWSDRFRLIDYLADEQHPQNFIVVQKA